MTRAELLKRMALSAEQKAAEAAESNAPWARGNLRLYQNLASKYWRDFYLEQTDTD